MFLQNWDWTTSERRADNKTFQPTGYKPGLLFILSVLAPEAERPRYT